MSVGILLDCVLPLYIHSIFSTLANRSARKEKQTQSYESVKRKDCASFSKYHLLLKCNIKC